VFMIMNLYGDGCNYRGNGGNIGDVRIFRQVRTSQKIITLRLVFLYCSGQLMLWL
jgi:hypothetical protein